MTDKQEGVHGAEWLIEANDEIVERCIQIARGAQTEVGEFADIIARHYAPHAARVRALREAAKAVELWVAPPSPERWEAIAEWFYQDTGILRPGKDQSAANAVSDSERKLAWDVWCSETKLRIWTELTTAIAALEADDA